MNGEDIRVAVFGLALITCFWAGVAVLVPRPWFRKLITGKDGTEKE